MLPQKRELFLSCILPDPFSSLSFAAFLGPPFPLSTLSISRRYVHGIRYEGTHSHSHSLDMHLKETGEGEGPTAICNAWGWLQSRKSTFCAVASYSILFLYTLFQGLVSAFLMLISDEFMIATPSWSFQSSERILIVVANDTHAGNFFPMKILKLYNGIFLWCQYLSIQCIPSYLKREGVKVPTQKL